MGYLSRELVGVAYSEILRNSSRSSDIISVPVGSVAMASMLHAMDMLQSRAFLIQGLASCFPFATNDTWYSDISI